MHRLMYANLPDEPADVPIRCWILYEYQSKLRTAQDGDYDSVYLQGIPSDYALPSPPRSPVAPREKGTQATVAQLSVAAPPLESVDQLREHAVESAAIVPPTSSSHPSAPEGRPLRSTTELMRENEALQRTVRAANQERGELLQRLAAHDADARAMRAQLPVDQRLDSIEREIGALRRSLQELVVHISAQGEADVGIAYALGLRRR